MKLLDIYGYTHPGLRVTNFTQVLAGVENVYPHALHGQLMAFGKNAGFTNSIYEKYVFFPPGITNRWVDGEAFLMNARPYPGPEGHLERNVLSKTGAVYHRKTLREEHIQRLLAEAGIPYLKPEPMPSPPPVVPQEQYREPLSIRFARFFERVAREIGVPGVTGDKLQRCTYVVLGVGVVGLVLFSAFRIWHSRVRKRNG